MVELNMRARWGRIISDIRNRRFVDAYSAAFVAFTLAVISLIGDVVPDQLRWAALLAGVGILVLRVTTPEPAATIDMILMDRFKFDEHPLQDRIRNAKEVCIFAPSGVNILSAHNCELLRKGVLSKSGGIVRVVVLDPGQEAAIGIATRQLDDALDYPVQDFGASLDRTLHLLRSMASWKVDGSFEFKLLPYNPGFSLVAIDPSAKNGQIIVEFHGFHNESTSSRMHIEVTRAQSERWYTYWVTQFGEIWESALQEQPSGH